MVDPDTWVTVHAAVKQCQLQGLDLAEVLNHRGLLLTPEQRKKIRVTAMEHVLNRVTDWRPTEFLRRRFRATDSCTPADMYTVMTEYIEDLIQEAKK